MSKIRKIDTARRVYELDGKCSFDDPSCVDCFNHGDCKTKGSKAGKASALAYILKYSRKPEELARLQKARGGSND